MSVFEYERRRRMSDVEYADEDETGQLSVGVPGEQRAIPTLAADRKPRIVFRDMYGREIADPYAGDQGRGQ